jgi:hypothetical protein
MLAQPSWPEGGGPSTSQGRPYTIFRRELEHGNLLVAEAAAKEIGRVSLGEAADPRALPPTSPAPGRDHHQDREPDQRPPGNAQRPVVPAKYVPHLANPSPHPSAASAHAKHVVSANASARYTRLSPHDPSSGRSAAQVNADRWRLLEEAPGTRGAGPQGSRRLVDSASRLGPGKEDRRRCSMIEPPRALLRFLHFVLASGAFDGKNPGLPAVTSPP